MGNRDAGFSINSYAYNSDYCYSDGVGFRLILTFE